MAEYMYGPAEPVEAYALSVQADGLVLIDGDIFDATAAVDTIYLSCDRGYDLDAVCPVYIYPHGRDILFCSLYANGCGLLMGGDCL